ncbi:MAG: hypothetical protein M3Y58_07025 [Chloroflexota bacterium]|nr:hypothetical protein [Chloroflexota bacterium]
MNGERPRTIRLSFNREEWRRKRDARRVLLEKVRARRRLLIAQRKTTPESSHTDERKARD